MRLKLTFLAALVAAVAVAASAVPASAGVQARGQTEFDGTVLSKNRDNRSFRLRDFERGTVRIFVTRNTRFERIAGFAGLKVGRRTSRPWCASAMAAGLRSRSSARVATTAPVTTTAAATTVVGTTTTVATVAAAAAAATTTDRM